MSWYIGEMQISRTKQLDRRTFVKRVMFLADESCVLDGLVTDVLHVCSCTDDADVVCKGASNQNKP